MDALHALSRKLVFPYIALSFVKCIHNTVQIHLMIIVSMFLQFLDDGWDQRTTHSNGYQNRLSPFWWTTISVQSFQAVRTPRSSWYRQLWIQQCNERSRRIWSGFAQYVFVFLQIQSLSLSRKIRIKFHGQQAIAIKPNTVHAITNRQTRIFPLQSSAHRLMHSSFQNICFQTLRKD